MVNRGANRPNDCPAAAPGKKTHLKNPTNKTKSSQTTGKSATAGRFPRARRSSPSSPNTPEAAGKREIAAPLRHHGRGAYPPEGVPAAKELSAEGAVPSRNRRLKRAAMSSTSSCSKSARRDRDGDPHRPSRSSGRSNWRRRREDRQSRAARTREAPAAGVGDRVLARLASRADGRLLPARVIKILERRSRLVDPSAW